MYQVITILSVLFLATNAKAISSQDFLPSLYSYNWGYQNHQNSSNFYRTELQEFCSSQAKPLHGSNNVSSYSQTIFNISYDKFRKDPKKYSDQLDWLISCARKTGKLRVIVNFNFYRNNNQKKQICDTTGKPLAKGGVCPDKSNGAPGYAIPTVNSAMRAFGQLFGKLGPKNLNMVFKGSGYSVVEGFTLGEENVTWDYVRQDDETYKFTKNLRSNFLNKLYDSLRAKYGSWPKKYFQWYSPHRVKLNYRNLR